MNQNTIAIIGCFTAQHGKLNFCIPRCRNHLYERLSILDANLGAFGLDTILHHINGLSRRLSK